MLLSLNWLKEYVAIPKNVSAADLAQELTLHTVEVEKIEEPSKKFENVVVGEILEIKKHPAADRLQIATVNVKKKKLIIVCGAPNIAVGQLVPVALVGAILPNGLEIKETEIRGEKSSGMLCAEDELGLGKSHEGILILDKAKVGQDFADYLKIDDTILEVDNKSLSNRPDLWGHYGIAREISAFLNVKLKDLDLNKIKLTPDTKIPEKLNVKVEDKIACPRYQALKIDNIKIEDSPKWLQDYLVSIGLRPINNIVDITNYVMSAIGQPLHAFSADKVDKIIIRPAKDGELLECLDEKERKLDDSMLVIADNKKAIAIAGIIGGQNSAITPETTSIIIEAANFNAHSIRKTSTKLGLRTDASMRFEKGQDPNSTETALKMTVSLIKKISKKAEIASELIDINNSEMNAGLIEFDLTWARKIIGEDLPTKKITEILTNLGFNIVKEENNILNVKVPSWRATKDISIPEDLIEEVMRIIGYDNFVAQIPTILMEAPVLNEERLFERRIKDSLAKENDLTEVYNYSFVNEDEAKKANLDFTNYIKLANPISKQHTLLRQNLVIGLINNVKLNQYKYDNINLFEIGNVFLNVPGRFQKDTKSEDRLPYQEKQTSIVLAGDDKKLFFKAKSIVSNLLYSLIDQNINIDYLPTELIIGYADQNERATISIDGKNIGTIAKLDKGVKQVYGLKKEVIIVELGNRELLNLSLSYQSKKYQELPKFPPMVRDLAFVIEKKILYNDLKKEIESFHELIKSVELFDVYEGDKLGENKKNLAFHIIYQSGDRTLTTEEIDKIQGDLIKHLEKKFEAQIRNF
jgi:phenylalanyl-tRNA synthetase beta chain